MPDLSSIPPEQLEQHSLDARQFLDFRESFLPNGMRIVEAYNGSGLTFTLLPDRGLDIWSAHYKGIPLTWLSVGSPHPPDFGTTWKRQFNGGLLVTCGLTHVGPPETDAETGEQRDLHGLYSRLRASDISISRDGVSAVHLSGVVREAELFGEQLELVRWYTLNLGEPTIHLTDVITNVIDQPAPLMVLYHFNVGYPLVREGAVLVAPDAAVYPRDAAAAAGIDRWAEYDAASPGYAEQVFYHHVHADADGMSEVALLHDDFGLSVRWHAAALPYLTQWKNTRQGFYVSGIEPGNCVPEGRNAARASGRLYMLQPGESQTFHCRLTVLEGAAAVEQARERIAALAANGTPVSGCQLDDYATPNTR